MAIKKSHFLLGMSVGFLESYLISQDEKKKKKLVKDWDNLKETVKNIDILETKKTYQAKYKELKDIDKKDVIIKSLKEIEKIAKENDLEKLEEKIKNIRDSLGV